MNLTTLFQKEVFSVTSGTTLSKNFKISQGYNIKIVSVNTVGSSIPPAYVRLWLYQQTIAGVNYGHFLGEGYVNGSSIGNGYTIINTIYSDIDNSSEIYLNVRIYQLSGSDQSYGVYFTEEI